MTVRKSLALATISNYATALIAFGATVIIARQLTPAELGIFAISLALTGLLIALREGGVNAYIIQHQSSDISVLQSAFTAAVVLSLASATLLAITAPWASVFFQTPEITGILWIMTLGFLVYPFGATVMASLQKEMRFQTLLAIEVTASLVQSCIAVGLVFLGVGVYSLAIAVAASALVRTVFCLIIVPDFDQFRIHPKGVVAVLKFSALATASLILRQIRDGAFAVIAGRILGPAPVGMVDRSTALVRLYDKVIAGIYPVVLPAFAELHRTGEDSVAPLLRGQAMLNLSALCVYGFLIIAAEPLIVFLYGEQWRDAAAFVPPIMLAALIGSSIERLATPIYLSRGRVDIVLKIQAILTPMTILALILSTPHGVMPALWSLVGVSVIAAAADLFFLPKLLAVKPEELIRAFARAMIVITPALVIGYGVNELAVHWELGPFWHLLVVGPPYLAIVAISILIFRHPFADELKRFSKA